MNLSIAIFIFSVLIFFIVWIGMKDRRYLKKKAKEVLSPEVKKEIEGERVAFFEAQFRFGESLKRAKKKLTRDSFSNKP